MNAFVQVCQSLFAPLSLSTSIHREREVLNLVKDFKITACTCTKFNFSICARLTYPGTCSTTAAVVPVLDQIYCSTQQSAGSKVRTDLITTRDAMPAQQWMHGLPAATYDAGSSDGGTLALLCEVVGQMAGRTSPSVIGETLGILIHAALARCAAIPRITGSIRPSGVIGYL